MSHFHTHKEYYVKYYIKTTVIDANDAIGCLSLLNINLNFKILKRYFFIQ